MTIDDIRKRQEERRSPFNACCFRDGCTADVDFLLVEPGKPRHVFIPYYANSKYDDAFPLGVFGARAAAYKAVKKRLDEGYEEWREMWNWRKSNNAFRIFGKHMPHWFIKCEEVQ